MVDTTGQLQSDPATGIAANARAISSYQAQIDAARYQPVVSQSTLRSLQSIQGQAGIQQAVQQGQQQFNISKSQAQAQLNSAKELNTQQQAAQDAYDKAVGDYNAQKADIEARQLAIKQFQDRIPYSFVTGPSYQYLKQLYKMDNLSQQSFYKQAAELQKKLPAGENLIYGLKQNPATGTKEPTITGVISKTFGGAYVPINSYNQAADIFAKGQLKAQQDQISTNLGTFPSFQESLKAGATQSVPLKLMSVAPTQQNISSQLMSRDTSQFTKTSSDIGFLTNMKSGLMNAAGNIPGANVKFPESNRFLKPFESIPVIGTFVQGAEGLTVGQASKGIINSLIPQNPSGIKSTALGIGGLAAVGAIPVVGQVLAGGALTGLVGANIYQGYTSLKALNAIKPTLSQYSGDTLQYNEALRQFNAQKANIVGGTAALPITILAAKGLEVGIKAGFKPTEIVEKPVRFLQPGTIDYLKGAEGEPSTAVIRSLRQVTLPTIARTTTPVSNFFRTVSLGALDLTKTREIKGNIRSIQGGFTVTPGGTSTLTSQGAFIVPKEVDVISGVTGSVKSGTIPFSAATVDKTNMLNIISQRPSSTTIATFRPPEFNINPSAIKAGEPTQFRPFEVIGISRQIKTEPTFGETVVNPLTNEVTQVPVGMTKLTPQENLLSDLYQASKSGLKASTITSPKGITSIFLPKPGTTVVATAERPAIFTFKPEQGQNYFSGGAKVTRGIVNPTGPELSAIGPSGVTIGLKQIPSRITQAEIKTGQPTELFIPTKPLPTTRVGQFASIAKEPFQSIGGGELPRISLYKADILSTVIGKRGTPIGQPSAVPLTIRVIEKPEVSAGPKGFTSFARNLEGRKSTRPGITIDELKTNIEKRNAEPTPTEFGPAGGSPIQPVLLSARESAAVTRGLSAALSQVPKVRTPAARNLPTPSINLVPAAGAYAGQGLYERTSGGLVPGVLGVRNTNLSNNLLISAPTVQTRTLQPVLGLNFEGQKLQLGKQTQQAKQDLVLVPTLGISFAQPQIQTNQQQQSLVPILGLGTTQAQQQVQQQQQQQIGLTGIFPILTQPKPPVPPIKPGQETPIIPSGSESAEARARRIRKIVSPLLFPVIIKRGKIETLAPTRILGEAARRGKQEVKTTLAASYGVLGPTGLIPLGLPTEQGFYRGKKNPLLIVQTRGTRLASGQERRQIQQAKKATPIGLRSKVSRRRNKPLGLRR